MTGWIIVSMTTKCPNCGREFTSKGDDAISELDASAVACPDCGFLGEINHD